MEIQPQRDIGTWHRTSLSPEQIAAIRMAAKRLRKRLMISPGNSRSSIAGTRRHAKTKAREFIKDKKRRNKPVPDYPYELVKEPYKASLLLTGFFPDREKIWKPIRDRHGSQLESVVNLEEFSFIDNPIVTMNHLVRLAEAEARAVDVRLNFIDDRCLDIGSFLVLGAMMPSMLRVFSGGRISPAIAKVLDAVHLRQNLGMGKVQLVDGHKDVWAFRLRSRRPAGSSLSSERHLEPQSREKIADDLIDAVNGWLGEASDQELTLEGKRYVIKIIGEGLCNAERHSSVSGDDDGDWSIAGFMAKRVGPDGSDYYRVHLAFLSIGASIADTMNRASDETRQLMANYVARHLHRFKKGPFRRDDLETVFAIQDGITSIANASAESRGGTGIQDILSFFRGLSSGDDRPDNAQLCIVSGRTFVSFRHPYYCGLRKNSQIEEPRELWFNERNTPTEEPDSSHVIPLDTRLNGTLVSMAFNLRGKNVRDANIDNRFEPPDEGQSSDAERP